MLTRFTLDNTRPEGAHTVTIRTYLFSWDYVTNPRCELTQQGFESWFPQRDGGSQKKLSLKAVVCRPNR